jgi:serine/threonine protein kinase
MDLIRENGKLKESVVSHIIRDVVLGLTAMHENKLIHRDIKPENILLSETGTAKLTDFGWSNSIETDNNSRKTYCGTNEYLAPEIIQGKDHDESVDLWCLGVLIYELLFGFAPFSPRNADTGGYEYKQNLDRRILKVDYSFPKAIPVSVLVLKSERSD